ncbi:hypothetical protein Pelo_9491 [Pelomyxa schiedti]|nr:hypothetical protein Pelo_9491 [Pelomyxa schiedti]
MMKTVMTGGRPYAYTKLDKLHLRLGEPKTDVWGVVLEDWKIEQCEGRGGPGVKYKKHLVLCDETCPNGRVDVYMYNAGMTGFPECQANDIIRLHRVQVLSGASNKPYISLRLDTPGGCGSSWVLLRGTIDQPMASSEQFTWGPEDRGRGNQLLAWIKHRVQNPVVARPFTSIGKIINTTPQGNQDLICFVVAVFTPTTGKPRKETIIWDGTGSGLILTERAFTFGNVVVPAPPQLPNPCVGSFMKYFCWVPNLFPVLTPGTWIHLQARVKMFKNFVELASHPECTVVAVPSESPSVCSVLSAHEELLRSVLPDSQQLAPPVHSTVPSDDQVPDPHLKCISETGCQARLSPLQAILTGDVPCIRHVHGVISGVYPQTFINSTVLSCPVCRSMFPCSAECGPSPRCIKCQSPLSVDYLIRFSISDSSGTVEVILYGQEATTFFGPTLPPRNMHLPGTPQDHLERLGKVFSQFTPIHTLDCCVSSFTTETGDTVHHLSLTTLKLPSQQNT